MWVSGLFYLFNWFYSPKNRGEKIYLKEKNQIDKSIYCFKRIKETSSNKGKKIL